MFGIFASICYLSSSSLLTMTVYMLLYPIFMTVPFSNLFSSIILAYVKNFINNNYFFFFSKILTHLILIFQTLGFILGALYALDAYWAFKYYKGYP